MFQFSKCSVSYTIENCTSDGKNGTFDGRGIKDTSGPIEQGGSDNGGSGSKYAALSVAGVVLVALLGFASHRLIIFYRTFYLTLLFFFNL